jgi:hypothetical protein
MVVLNCCPTALPKEDLPGGMIKKVCCDLEGLTNLGIYQSYSSYL